VENDQTTTPVAAQEDFRAKYLSAAAEVENTKKRMQRRADDAARAQKKRLLLKFLPVLDNLARALEFRDSGELRDGLAATLRGFKVDDELLRPALVVVAKNA
jgi:molecular chaperone GrpE (heat shock protein)